MLIVHRPGYGQEQRAGGSWRPNWLPYLIPVGMLVSLAGVGLILFKMMTGIVWPQYAGAIILLMAICIWAVASILVIGFAVSWFFRWIRGRDARDSDWDQGCSGASRGCAGGGLPW